MPGSVDLNSEQFLELLGEALRAGPGSPQWHQAVLALRDHAGEDVSEYRLLIAAREHLESGRNFRDVRAGPEFTRKLLERLENERPVRGWPMASALAVVSTVLVGLAIGVGVYLVFIATDETSPGIEDLARMSFVQPTEVASFTDGVPDGWDAIGQTALVAENGLRLPPRLVDGPHGGGMVWTQPLAAGEPFAMEVTILNQGLSDRVMAQIFVTDQPQFGERATSPSELVWTLAEGQARLTLPDQRFAGEMRRVQSGPAGTVVRIRMNRDFAIVESAGEAHWSGPHQLSAVRPRYVGVRLLQQGDGHEERISIQGVRVLKETRDER